MSRPTIVELADAAAGLLAARHETQRRVEAGLDATYEAPAAARTEFESVRARDGAPGVVAVAGDRPLGFLRGAPLDESCGPNVW